MSWNNLTERWKDYFRSQLHLAQSMSKDENTKVGAIIIDTNSRVVVASGWNDLPRGVEHLPERNQRPLKYLYTSHAEQSCLMNALRLNVKVNGMTMLCTMACCTQCAASIINSGIGQLVTPPPDFDHVSCGEDYVHSIAMIDESVVQWTYNLEKEDQS